MSPQESKPPLGVEPQEVWRKRRVEELASAISRYVTDGNYRKCVELWAKELATHVQFLNSKTESE